MKEDLLKENVTFGILTAKEFKNHIDCELPFLYPQVRTILNYIKLSYSEWLYFYHAKLMFII
jgi:hypothetical protein